MKGISGRCLCGEVRYTCSKPVVMAGYCQCKDCQKLSGTGHTANIAVPKGSLSFVGELAYHQKQADSGNTITRGFCPKCGSHIYASNNGMSEFEFIRAGSLDDLELFKPSMVVYASSGASWDHLSQELPKFDKMPEL
ncbi:GFA family protein [Vibrio sp. TRT 21S02]|uniref:GFA family protein n=1 Tax=unclassified Vibrio TaxID=2614977 RepID=UPI00349F8F42